MLSKTNEIKSYSPKNLDELDKILQNLTKPCTFIGGATDLMVNLKKWAEIDCLIDLTHVEEMAETIQPHEGGVLIGAAVSLSEIIESDYIQNQFPILETACRLIGSVQIQNRATLGGNIGNASPAGDSLPVLNVLDAELWIGPRVNGEFRKLSVKEIMANPGETVLKQNQYLTFIFLPPLPGENFQWYYRKVGQRLSMAISKVSLAVLADIEDEKVKEIRISAGAVTPRVNRAEKTESFLIGKKLTPEIITSASEKLKEEISPIADIRSSVEYRRETSGNLLREALWSFM